MLCSRLTPWDPSLHEQVRDRMMLLGGGCGNGLQWERSGKNNGNHGVGAGLSWLDTDAMTYMTEAAKGVSIFVYYLWNVWPCMRLGMTGYMIFQEKIMD